ncbi:MAG: Bax inhibitor-1/YccA family protein [Bacteroidetes bacterium]|nr:Bax inhibitor-1/YccA family protein [Bacteroidota bacterium]MBU1577873.1 Bax inhibitor-1/YccA family protein [Bacteroidota bacterium]MBU2465296.1 Bax inhibitor-1/YccA family protein [Bacteroidota bacterium]MBU2558244.1 Bax inhibitor-1/YccA family protein [Bacteroidota bacterium]
MNRIQQPYSQKINFQSQALAKTFLANVFSWMFLALAITALVAYLIAGNESFMQLMYNTETGGMSMTGWIIMLSPLGLVFWMSMGFAKMSAQTLTLVFLAYSILMGLSLSFIFLAYTGASIAKTFVITSGMFGLMAVVGYTTKTDLSKFGSLMMMGLVGIIIASVVNFFMKSAMMDYIISFIGVLVFTGLTAYDVQKLKRIGASAMSDGEGMRKITIMGALTLYLDFINLFLFLLRFFGNRR